MGELREELAARRNEIGGREGLDEPFLAEVVVQQGAGLENEEDAYDLMELAAVDRQVVVKAGGDLLN